MINVTYKKMGIKINSVWFCCDDDIDKIVNDSRADIIFFHAIGKNKFKNSFVSEQFSLITDLTVPAEEIFGQFNRNYRSQINRVKNENADCAVYTSMDLNNNSGLLSSFKKEYKGFTKLKGIKNYYNEAAIKQYVKKGCVILTKVCRGEENFAQHVYVYDNNTARILYSVCNFRTEGMDPNFSGRANKYLHWQDIQYLKENKISLLDWGGINSMNDSNGVDRFKKQFGGKEISYYNVIIGKSILGKLAVSLIKLKRGFD